MGCFINFEPLTCGPSSIKHQQSTVFTAVIWSFWSRWPSLTAPQQIRSAVSRHSLTQSHRAMRWAIWCFRLQLQMHISGSDADLNRNVFEFAPTSRLSSLFPSLSISVDSSQLSCMTADSRRENKIIQIPYHLDHGPVRLISRRPLPKGEPKCLCCARFPCSKAARVLC